MVLNKYLVNHGNPTSHFPELILNNFTSRIGRKLCLIIIARMLISLFPKNPEFIGHQVVTFHNQRDFIFVRHHRYDFDDDGTKTNLQEIGPRFTLKLMTMQHGTFDTAHGEYEFIYKVQ